ncbi:MULTISPECIES: S9 family peptidase [unclassified Isoptericola]|uniref:alpha/beta hydrolase family protein n=1 Tax=unclassified Isoptericola TaxID=2623355 RepID=UPI002712B843|nr:MULTISPECIES: alpha/beta hydrolase [unclassified Isoptericola]MDO8143364.1 alpha/beta hydrolase [Isoptericola sp. 178]MDO8147227.1 alpha/beta hydrolase [Isoptericola sp. b515]MDO8150460.1 alpha/beta hydrolase [Isoptericola sp. b408]
MAERVTFASSTGPMLAGIIDEPEGEVRGWGVFVHGFTLGKDSPAAARISKQLAAEGIGMLRFDNLGLGDSEGDWGDGSFTIKVADVVRAAEFMADRGTPVELLVGHSWGGAAAIAAAPEIPGVRAVASVCAPFDPSHAENHYDDLVDQVLEEGNAVWQVGGKRLNLKRGMVEDVRDADLEHRISELDTPLMIMHSPTDQVVGIENASKIFAAARHPRSFVSLEGSDHLLTRPGQAQRAARIISAWANQYLRED